MNKKTKRIIIIILVLLLVIFIFFKINTASKNGENNNSSDIGYTDSNQDYVYVLDNYPLEAVPLYKSTRIESMKFFINNDPESYFGYFKDSGEAGVNYYNVVFETTAEKQDFLNYYKSLMSEVSSEFSSDSQIYGMLAGYEVSIAHRSGNTAYMQVFLPSYSSENPYLVDYPDEIVDINENLVERENSYGKLNQNGGEIEYTKYFVLIEDYDKELDKEEPFSDLYDIYKEKYISNEDFIADDEDEMLKWTDGEHEITLNFMASHGRVYLMIRKPFN